MRPEPGRQGIKRRRAAAGAVDAIEAVLLPPRPRPAGKPPPPGRPPDKRERADARTDIGRDRHGAEYDRLDHAGSAACQAPDTTASARRLTQRTRSAIERRQSGHGIRGRSCRQGLGRLFPKLIACVAGRRPDEPAGRARDELLEHVLDRKMAVEERADVSAFLEGAGVELRGSRDRERARRLSSGRACPRSRARDPRPRRSGTRRRRRPASSPRARPCTGLR